MGFCGFFLVIERGKVLFGREFLLYMDWIFICNCLVFGILVVLVKVDFWFVVLVWLFGLKLKLGLNGIFGLYLNMFVFLFVFLLKFFLNMFDGGGGGVGIMLDSVFIWGFEIVVFFGIVLEFDRVIFGDFNVGLDGGRDFFFKLFFFGKRGIDGGWDGFFVIFFVFSVGFDGFGFMIVLDGGSGVFFFNEGLGIGLVVEMIVILFVIINGVEVFFVSWDVGGFFGGGIGGVGNVVLGFFFINFLNLFSFFL